MHSTTSTRRTSATLVYDGDCGFCTSAVRWLERTLPTMPQATPYQWAGLDALGLGREEAAERVWLVTATVSVNSGSREAAPRVLHQYGGHLAVAQILRHQPQFGWRFLGFLLDTPPFSLIAGIGYALVARYRYLLPGGTPACAVRQAP